MTNFSATLPIEKSAQKLKKTCGKKCASTTKSTKTVLTELNFSQPQPTLEIPHQNAFRRKNWEGLNNATNSDPVNSYSFSNVDELVKHWCKWSSGKK